MRKTINQLHRRKYSTDSTLCKVHNTAFIHDLLDMNQLLELMEKLGKHKTSVGCLYIKRLSDVDQKVLATLIEKSFQYMKKTNK